MRVEITATQDPTQLYQTIFNWKLWTGPDGIDCYEGCADSLVECVDAISKVELLNSFGYVNDEACENPGETISKYLSAFTPQS